MEGKAQRGRREGMRENGKEKAKDAQQTPGGPRKIFNPNSEYCHFLPQSAFPVLFHGRAWGAKKCRAAWHESACGGGTRGPARVSGAAVEHSHHRLRPASASRELQAGRGARRGDGGGERCKSEQGPNRPPWAFSQDSRALPSPSPSCRSSTSDFCAFPRAFTSFASQSFVSS